jgi:hypothetical protein
MGGGGNGSEPMTSPSSTGDYADAFPGGGQEFQDGEEGEMGQVEIPSELEPEEAVAASTVLGRLFEKLSLLSLLKVDASVQVSAGAVSDITHARYTAPHTRLYFLPTNSEFGAPNAPRKKIALPLGIVGTPPSLRATNIVTHPPSCPSLFPIIAGLRATPQAAELSRSVGEEISRVMEKQQGLENRFESLISVRGVLKAMPNKTKYKAGALYN